MAIREEQDEGIDWTPIGGGTHFRVLPAPIAGNVEPGVMPTARVQTQIVTTETLAGGPGPTLCEQCSQPIASGTFPTPGYRFGGLICEACSTDLGRSSMVSKGKRRPGRPRKHEREEA